MTTQERIGKAAVALEKKYIRERDGVGLHKALHDLESWYDCGMTAVCRAWVLEQGKEIGGRCYERKAYNL